MRQGSADGTTRTQGGERRKNLAGLTNDCRLTRGCRFEPRSAAPARPSRATTNIPHQRTQLVPCAARSPSVVYSDSPSLYGPPTLKGFAASGGGPLCRAHGTAHIGRSQPGPKLPRRPREEGEQRQGRSGTREAKGAREE